MKRKRYTDEQIAYALRQAEAGTTVAELLGDCDEALRLFREAIALGYSDWIDLHGGYGCVSENPAFQKLIAPKG